MTDEINKPDHYANNMIEPADFIMYNNLSFWKGNIIKYVVRAGIKQSHPTIIESEINDLKKVIRYAEMRINQLEGNAPSHVKGK
tara:strand:- start:201 stop:452 length:252 start_codon:yes stop_codon:yes gene_type:complete